MRYKIRTKEEILLSAETLIREEGLDACTMRRLADHTGIAVGTLYNYFPSHQALLEELFVASWSNTLAKLENLKEGTAEEDLKEFVDLFRAEVRSRDGLGIKLYGTHILPNSYSKVEFSVFTKILERLQKILKKSSKFKGAPDEELEINSRWIILILVDHLLQNSPDEAFFTDQIVKRFI